MLIGHKPFIYQPMPNTPQAGSGFYAVITSGATMLTRNNITAGRPGVTTSINRTSSVVNLAVSMGGALKFSGLNPGDSMIVSAIIGGDPLLSASLSGVDLPGTVSLTHLTREDGVNASAGYFDQDGVDVYGATLRLQFPTSSGVSKIGQLFIGTMSRFKCIADEYAESRQQRSAMVRSVGGQPYVVSRGVTESRRITVAGSDYQEMWGGGGIENMLSSMDKYRPLLICPMTEVAFSGNKSIGAAYLAYHSRIAYSVGDAQITTSPPYFKIDLDLEIPPEQGRI